MASLCGGGSAWLSEVDDAVERADGAAHDRAVGGEQAGLVAVRLGDGVGEAEAAVEPRREPPEADGVVAAERCDGDGAQQGVEAGELLGVGELAAGLGELMGWS